MERSTWNWFPCGLVYTIVWEIVLDEFVIVLEEILDTFSLFRFSLVGVDCGGAKYGVAYAQPFFICFGFYSVGHL